MKTSGSGTFVDFFSLMLEVLVSTVGAGIDEGEVVAILVKVLAGGNGGVAIAALVGGLASSGSVVFATEGVDSYI